MKLILDLANSELRFSKIHYKEIASKEFISSKQDSHSLNDCQEDTQARMKS